MWEKEDFNLLYVLTYTFLWTTLYFLLCLRDSKRSYEWHCRMVTLIHASFISFISFYSVFAYGPWPWTDAGGPNVPHQVRTCTICLGYFLFDFAWCLYFRTEGAVMLCHHLLSIVGMTWCLMAGKYGTETVITIAGAEITNPLLQLRWFIKETGYYNTVWGDVVDAAFMLSFGFVRIGLGSYLLYCYFLQPTDFLGRLGGVLIYSIGWVFFISMIRYAIYKTNKQSQQRSASPPQSSNASHSHSSCQMARQNNHHKRNSKASVETNLTSCSDNINGVVMTEGNADVITSQIDVKMSGSDLILRKNKALKALG